MFIFGSGTLVGTPLTDGTGTELTNPSPIQLGTLQGVTADLSADIKKLYGNLQYPVAAGRGQATASLTANFATINAGLFNAFVFGQTMNTGSFTSFIDNVGQLIPESPFEVTVDPPGTGVFAYDLGVQDGAGVAYTRVAAAPAAGQYTVDDETGVYLFAAADTGKKVFISFSHTTAGTGMNIAVANLPMGYAPFLQIDQYVQYAGKSMTIRWPNVMAGGLTLAMKNDDFTIPEMKFEAFADASGNIAYLSTSE